MTGKTKFIPLVALLALAGLALWFHIDKPHALSMVTKESSPPEPKAIAPEKKSPPKTKSAMANVAPSDVVDPKDWVENGPKEPLVPRELQVKAEPAPGEVVTAEPLVPKELRVNAEPVPGSTVTNEPLTPRELRPSDSLPQKP